MSNVVTLPIENHQLTGKQMMSESKFFMGYSRWLDDSQRYETWKESVARVMDMHRQKYAHVMTDKLTELIDFAEAEYVKQTVLGAQRALQFGGPQIFQHEGRLYNCSSSHLDRPEFFQEAMYLLLCGCGVGFSVQKHHINKLPAITGRGQDAMTYQVPDSIEGWSDAFGVLISSFIANPASAPFPEFAGKHVSYDFSQIRPKGSYISGGFKAPGADGLRASLIKCEDLMSRIVKTGATQLGSIDAYDFVMHMADAVLSGGVRRSATICMFSIDDQDMMNAKTGSWFIDNPQRGRSNNSVILDRATTTYEQWQGIKGSVKEFGEPGFVWTDNLEFCYNPCVEIGMLPVTEDGQSGFQMCVRADTQLITEDGLRTIGTCADASEPISIWNGKDWKTVTPFKTGTAQKFWRVTFSDGSYLDATKHHKFAVKHRFQKEYQTLTTQELQVALQDSKYALSVPRANIVHTGGVPNTSAYEYGFVLGDGSLHQNQVFASVHEGSGKDRLTFNNIRVKGPYQKSVHGYEKTDGSALANYKNIYFQDLDLGLVDALKNQSGLPSELFSWDRPSILKFIGGWADADGSQASKGIRIYGCEADIRDGQLLLTKCGIDASVNLMADAGAPSNLPVGVRTQAVWFLQIVQTIDIPCQRLTCDNTSKATMKGKNQVIRSVEELDVVEDSYCLYEETRNMCVFNNVLTFQCNLSEINGGLCHTADDFFRACEAGAILGTLQAGYTNFTYLTQATRQIVEREALIGVSVTGWMNNPDVLFNEDNMQTGAELVKAVNKRVAELIGINPAARTTAVKPSGNASVLLGTASGIHGEHSPRYFRNVQMNEADGALALIQEANPSMVETSVWNPNGTDKIVSFPIVSDEGSIYKDTLQGVRQLEFVKLAQQNWIEHGTNEHLCTDSRNRHNVSNTISVDDWDEVFDYIWENRAWFAGISLMSEAGDKAYPQSPFTEVRTSKQIHDLYGAASIMASGLIVDGLHAFSGDLWNACSVAMNDGKDLSEHGSHDLLKRDWVRRAKKFAHNNFLAPERRVSPAGLTIGIDLDQASVNRAMQTMTECLKDVHLLHKWETISREIVPINFTKEMGEQAYTEVATMGAQACAGGACSIEF